MGKLQKKYKKLSVYNESNIQHKNNTTDRGAIFVQEETNRDNSNNFKMEAYSEDF